MERNVGMTALRAISRETASPATACREIKAEIIVASRATEAIPQVTLTRRATTSDPSSGNTDQSNNPDGNTDNNGQPSTDGSNNSEANSNNAQGQNGNQSDQSAIQPGRILEYAGTGLGMTGDPIGGLLILIGMGWNDAGVTWNNINQATEICRQVPN